METDYGVDLGILIDLHMSGERILEVDVGTIEHESQPLAALSTMRHNKPNHFNQSTKVRAFRLFDRLFEFEEAERRRETDLVAVKSRLNRAKGIAMIDMDGTILRGRFIVQLAKIVGRSRELSCYLDRHDLEPSSRARMIANVFRVHTPKKRSWRLQEKWNCSRGS